MNEQEGLKARPSFVRYGELEGEYGIPYSRPSLSRLEKKGEFPKRIRWSANVIVWRRDEIERWLTERSNDRNHGSAA